MVPLDEVPRDACSVDEQQSRVSPMGCRVELSRGAMPQSNAGRQTPDVLGAGRQFGQDMPVRNWELRVHIRLDLVLGVAVGDIAELDLGDRRLAADASVDVVLDAGFEHELVGVGAPTTPEDELVASVGVKRRVVEASNVPNSGHDAKRHLRQDGGLLDRAVVQHDPVREQVLRGNARLNAEFQGIRCLRRDGRADSQCRHERQQSFHWKPSNETSVRALG